MPPPHTDEPVLVSHMLPRPIVCRMSNGRPPASRQKRRFGSSRQSFISRSSLNSGKIPSVHEDDTAFSGSYNGRPIRTRPTNAGGASSRSSSVSSWSAVLPYKPKIGSTRRTPPNIRAAAAAAAAAGTAPTLIDKCEILTIGCENNFFDSEFSSQHPYIKKASYC